MDMFDDFADEEAVVEQVVEDPMKKLESEKKRKAREESNLLLAQMNNDDGGGLFEEMPEAKRGRFEENEEHEQEDMEHIIVHTIRTDNENCTHEVAIPPKSVFTELKKSNAEPAKYYPFQLDAFQKQAILCIENNQSVLVSAHTSAGKTVVATYAIAQCLREKQRVIYTSPIKALSNQKYRELEEEFKDVGLMTGDVTINPDASCLVMTTEILRSMLYRGSEIMKEVGWVVYDEIHYMRDKERGVVWEETIILMSQHIKQAFLSATIPNAREFAQWVCFIKNHPVNVVYTDYRPTPLQHFIYPVGGEGMYEVVNVKGEFREDKFRDAMSGLSTAGDSAGSFQKRRTGGGTQGDSNVLKIIRSVASNDGLNCIVFSFSRKECESYAISLKDMDFNQPNEKTMVKSVYESAISQLSPEDQNLPQIMNILPLLKRGIGVHHSGLMPILKETIEILFGEGLVKVLFATETFSMGLNMPARTVVFTSARKFDGTDNRYISSGEYIQMAGRAGRRGKDDRGTVILMVDSAMSADDAKQIIKGATDPLNSQFRLTYNMVLNLLRVEGVAVSWIISHSFHQFQSFAKIPDINKKCSQAEKKVASFKFPWENEMNTYVQLKEELEKTRDEIMKIQREPRNLVGFLHAGRLLSVKSGDRDFKWGVLNQFKKEVNPNDKNDTIYVCDMIVAIDKNRKHDITNPATLVPGFDLPKRHWVRVPMSIDRITAISAIRLKIPADINTTDGEMRLDSVMTAAMNRLQGDVPLLHPITDMEIKTKDMYALVEREKSLTKRIEDHSMNRRDNFDELKMLYQQKMDAIKELEALEKERKGLKSTLHLEELNNRKRVLRRLGYLTTDDSLEMKGRVACELSASDELILTEMLLKGVFNSLDVAQTAALLSCFVFQDNCSAPKLSQELQSCLSVLQEQARHVAKVSNECKMEVVEDKYVGSFNPGLMDVVSQWVSGASFCDIVKTTDVFEGSIIRCLRRLEEVLREMIGAAKACANADLEQKFEDARKNLKRDIVFAASLYL
ncbi:CBN-MTR-4 protein [Caenorhabditis brenneri]|uniref:CBN-MTR-4 protein n=1 Tax=Caenorhabditis brenneri TaxID=135651 RepID=G0NUK0_CAEBE|nr:CBN-MTR-4 protein [Caenorhabditis brenneri]